MVVKRKGGLHRLAVPINEGFAKCEPGSIHGQVECESSGVNGGRSDRSNDWGRIQNRKWQRLCGAATRARSKNLHGCRRLEENCIVVGSQLCGHDGVADKCRSVVSAVD